MAIENLSNFLEQVRSRVILSDFVRPQVTLKRRGPNFLGLCPFHKEKTPSFTVNDAKGLYHCFGCGTGGDVFEFIQKTKNLPFLEAVEEIANRVGLALPLREAETAKTDPSLQGVLDASCRWFQDQLQLTHGIHARQYLEERGLKPETIEKFRLGYAPAQGLKSYLIKKGFSESIQITAGLLIRRDQGSPYERFRERLMFPILNRQGKVIAFGGRILGEGEPKYLNSPETPLFHKGKTLYSLSNIGAERQHVVVEGYMDVISLYQSGIKGTVAPLGTALTEEQITLLWRYGPEPILCFDGDNAGQKAAYKAAQRVLPLLKPGFTLRFCFLPAGEDPDSLVHSGQISRLHKLLATPMPLVDVLWQELISTHPLETPDEKAILHHKVVACWRMIQEPSLQHYYQQELETRLRNLVAPQWNPGANKSRSKQMIALPLKAPKSWAEKILLATLLNHPKLVIEFYEQLMSVQFMNAGYEKIRQLLLNEVFEEPIHLAHVHEKIVEHVGQRLVSELLNEQIYAQASFARSGSIENEARTGWLHVWQRFFERKLLEAQVSEVTASDNFDETTWYRLKHLKSALIKPS